MGINKNSIGLTEGIEEISYSPVHEYFQSIYQHHDHKFILESKDISPVYGRLSLIGLGPIIQISGKDNHFSIKCLDKRGQFFFSQITSDELTFCDEVKITDNQISGKIIKSRETFEENERSKQKNIAQIIRFLLTKFQLDQKSLLGLYGAFSYDFVRQFESIPDLLPENDTPDFNLFLYDTFIFFDHLKEKTEIILFRENEKKVQESVKQIKKQLESTSKNPTYQITDANFELKPEDYQDMVETAREYCRQGELFEVVFSNILKAKFDGDPFALYLKYRETNPSPYLFYFDFGDEQLVGASPEMMVRCEGGQVHLRPISGTAKRGKDPIEDHDNMLALLADEKERAELDMLIDLGRNDLSRICKPGIKISDYRFVEKYSQVMHTVAHLSGELAEDNTAFDALIASLNAGTLTGAPKVAAMAAIEKHEKERRGYYGGVVGYLTFAGDMDSGIIIRTAHIKNNNLRFQVGATLLYDSVPEKEYEETVNKAQAFLNTFNQETGNRKQDFVETRHGTSLQNPVSCKKILIIDNFDSFTFNLVDYFKQLRCEVSVYRNDVHPEIIDKVQPDLIVFSPGPSVPKNAGNMMAIIEKYHQTHPMFGVCLGHEAFIEFFGGSLKLIEPVHGKTSPIHHDGKTIFKNTPQNFLAGRYHSLIANKVPDCFEISATANNIVMAIRHKTLPIEGVQFHPESVLTMKKQNGLGIIKNLNTP